MILRLDTVLTSIPLLEEIVRVKAVFLSYLVSSRASSGQKLRVLMKWFLEELVGMNPKMSNLELV